MKYIYISDKTKEKLKLAKSPSRDILQSYRNIKKSTDVLSFLVDGHDEYLLGEIFISLEYAKKNCAINGNSLSKEVKILSIHAILHLIGYEHATTKEEKDMFELQNKLYQKFK